MPTYRKPYEIIGHAYDADLHCVSCTIARFSGQLTAAARDSEGNPPYPITLGDEHDTPPHCGDCGDPLD